MYNILICDDEKDIVSALKIYLANDDYHLFEAYNGRQALEVIEKEELHLILFRHYDAGAGWDSGAYPDA